jgi:hypothetical protein
MNHLTFYSRNGDVFLLMCALFFLVGFVSVFFKRKS